MAAKSKRVPDRCRGCVGVNHGMPGTKYENWCCHHSMPLKRADPHCRTGGGNDKRREA